VRNAFQPKFFLTTGDWTARLWNEDLRAPICTLPYAAAALTAARWSPTRRALGGPACVWRPLAAPARGSRCHLIAASALYRGHALTSGGARRRARGQRAPGAFARPAVFLVARADGALDCWDYLADQATPALTLQVPTPRRPHAPLPWVLRARGRAGAARAHCPTYQRSACT